MYFLKVSYKEVWTCRRRVRMKMEHVSMSFYNGNKRFKKTSLTDLELDKNVFTGTNPFSKRTKTEAGRRNYPKNYCPGSSTIVYKFQLFID